MRINHNYEHIIALLNSWGDILDEKKVKCSCKWVKCKRHGDCIACIEHHKKNEKHPLPFCMKVKVNTKKKVDEEKDKN